MSIFTDQANCFFYRTGGSTLAGGCTKAYLDSVNGNLSTVMDANGEPAFSGNVALTNIVMDSTKGFTCQDAAAAAKSAVGLIGRVSGGLAATTAKEGDTVSYKGSWAGEMYFSSDTVDGDGDSEVMVDNGVMFAGATSLVCLIDGDTICQSYPIKSVSGNTVTVQDGGLLAYTSGVCAPDIVAVELLTIGGAFSSLQDIVNAVDAQWHDQWIFVGDTVNVGATPINITSASDGSLANNTKLCIVGYIASAYDCLPAGYGYWDQDICIPISRAYKTAKNRAIVGNDFSNQSLCLRLMTESAVSSPCWFSLQSSSQNIYLMGICFYTTKQGTTASNGPRIAYADQQTLGNVHVRHCTAISNNGTINQTGMILTDEAGSAGEVTDCYSYNWGAVTTESSSIITATFYDIHANCFEAMHQANNGYVNVAFHHNIVRSFQIAPWASGTGTLHIYSNTFYASAHAITAFMSFIGMSHAVPTQSFYNNICVVDSSDADPTWAILRVSGGGSVYYCDHNLFHDMQGEIPDERKIQRFTNTTWQYGSYGQLFGSHSIWNQDPLFVNPGLWDFSLKPNSPCINTGRPDINGNPTYMGAIEPAAPQDSVGPIGIYGRHKSFFGV